MNRELSPFTPIASRSARRQPVGTHPHADASPAAFDEVFANLARRQDGIERANERRIDAAKSAPTPTRWIANATASPNSCATSTLWPDRCVRPSSTPFSGGACPASFCADVAPIPRPSPARNVHISANCHPAAPAVSWRWTRLPQLSRSGTMPYTLPPLPYPNNALSPTLMP